MSDSLVTLVLLSVVLGLGLVVSPYTIADVQSGVESAQNTSINLSSGTEQLNETALELAIHDEVNDVRSQRGLTELRYAPELAQAAQYHSDDMVAEDYFGHTAPGGETMSDRYARFGIDCRVSTGSGMYATGAENVLYTYYQEELLSGTGDDYYSTPTELAQGIVAQWMNSPGHRENILRPFWRREGLGINVTETDEGTRVYATQNFC